MSTTTTPRSSVIASHAGGLQFSVAMRGHQLLTDQPRKVGGEDAAPMPLELLSASLASCIALYIYRFCETRQLPGEEVAVEVKPFWTENPGRFARFEVLIHLPASIPQRYHPLIERVAATCPVHHTLTHPPQIEVHLQTEPGLAVAEA